MKPNDTLDGSCSQMIDRGSTGPLNESSVDAMVMEEGDKTLSIPKN